MAKYLGSNEIDPKAIEKFKDFKKKLSSKQVRSQTTRNLLHPP